MKKLISILLSALLIISVICSAQFAVSAAVEETETVGASSGTTGECTWTLDDNGTLIISGNGKMGDYEDKYQNGSYITTAPWGANIKSVVIENGVTSIGYFAFYGCKNLTSIEIPDSVKSIGYKAFYGCIGLTSVDIPDSVTSIEIGAFSGCKGLTRVNISDVAAWCRISFSNIENDIANPLTYAHNLYLNNELVTDLIIPDGVTSIGYFAFEGCTSLTSVTIPESVTSIGSVAFYGCSSLTTVDIPNSITYIGATAFYGCASLQSITIPDSVKHIEEGAFGFSNGKKMDGFTIYGEPGTEAEKYAYQYGFLFNGEYIGEATTAEPTTEEPTTEPTTEEPTTVEPTTCEPTTEPIKWLEVNGVSNYSPTVNVTMYDYSGSDTATIVFTAIETLDVSCFNFGLNYDKNKLELVSESYFTDDMVTNNDSSDYCIIGNVANSENPYHITKKQELASFTFKQRGYEKTTVDFRVINMEIKTAYDEQFRVVDGVLQSICLHKSALVEKGYPADCVNNGLTDYIYCSNCNKVFSEKKVIPATGHKPVIDPAVPATCQHDGHTIGSHCENCGLIYVQYDIIPKLPHTEVYDEAVAPSCTETGLTAGSHCSVCGDAIKPQSIVPALGHSYVAVPGKPATHFKTGTTDGIKCSRCGEWLIEQEIIPKLEGDVAIGDSNGDGNVDVLDAATIQKFASGMADMTSDQQYFADVNNDGVVDILDAAEIQKFAAGIITEFKKKG